MAMPHVALLVAKPGSGAVDDALVTRTLDGLFQSTPWGNFSRWLAPQEAIEFDVEVESEAARKALLAKLKAAVASAPVDAHVIPAEARAKKLLIADMDSTIIQQECIDEMADVLGLKPKIAAITERAMRGELPFEAALRERVALLKGISTADLQKVFDERVKLTPGAKTLLATMRAKGAFTALVSGGFTFFTERVAKVVGFDVNHANSLDMANGLMTGTVAEPIVGREAKRAALESYRTKRGLAPEETLAVGDGANDLDMIRAAGLGVAYRAKPVVAEEAHAGVTHGDLTSLLYLQGYAAKDFVRA
ncbi:MAG: phosphoserine phosphatase SerB [Pseudomonadota bacterium]